MLSSGRRDRATFMTSCAISFLRAKPDPAFILCMRETDHALARDQYPFQKQIYVHYFWGIGSNTAWTSGSTEVIKHPGIEMRRFDRPTPDTQHF
jgi:hypothetical protein